MEIKKIMPNINKHIDESKPYIKPSTSAHKGLNVPEIVLRYGSIASKAKSLPKLQKYMRGCMTEMKKSYSEIYKQPNNSSKTITDDDLDDLRSLAIKLGASDIAFTKVNPSYIFDDKVILYPNAIVVVMEMNHEIISTAPSGDAETEIFRTYYELCKIVNAIKDFLNERGYNAEAGPSLGGEVNYPMLAQDAGLGTVGKHGLLITPELGPSLRLAAVYTDIENLPLSVKNDHLWIKEFCDKCNRCVKACPVGAIFEHPIVLTDNSIQCIDYKKCAVPFSRNKGCTRCVKECTFFASEYEKIKKGFNKKTLQD